MSVANGDSKRVYLVVASGAIVLIAALVVMVDRGCSPMGKWMTPLTPEQRLVERVTNPANEFQALLCVRTANVVPTNNLELDFSFYRGIEAGSVQGQRVPNVVFVSVPKAAHYCHLLAIYDGYAVLDLTEGPDNVLSVQLCAWSSTAQAVTDVRGEAHAPCTEILPYEGKKYGIAIKLETTDPAFMKFTEVVVGRRNTGDPTLLP